MSHQVIETELSRACSIHGTDQKCLQNFGQNTQREESLGRPRYRRQGNFKIIIKYIQCEHVNLIHLAVQCCNVVNTVMNPEVLGCVTERLGVTRRILRQVSWWLVAES
jgi:hypothetical protein